MPKTRKRRTAPAQAADPAAPEPPKVPEPTAPPPEEKPAMVMPVHDEAGLKKIAVGLIEGRYYSTAHIKDRSEITHVFPILWMMDQPMRDWFIEHKVTFFYEEFDRQVPAPSTGCRSSSRATTSAPTTRSACSLSPRTTASCARRLRARFTKHSPFPYGRV